ncbi:hypothetical protein SAMN05444395_101537 [Flavobacterium fryxellicola]|uniref:Uncharacterized protein n=1 Tax=Flavobacterium fryxellicola TaxID=249352 RepID=A0A168AH77_9FLAO|nr:hypothetical protein [Flavobacterium fryxellicola]OAB31468.1 hypothetical protein FBFR_01165 [Flavobacterium fryxellicola]SHN53497.1 hypothetical protein SAMN05444395_101537 [Flavobacterium fryxellicola]
MTLSKKIEHLEQVLNQPAENFANSFKSDIILFFDDNFSENNTQLFFLNDLNSKEEIQSWVEILTSRFVMKFEAEFEAENDFINDYLENG